MRHCSTTHSHSMICLPTHDREGAAAYLISRKCIIYMRGIFSVTEEFMLYQPLKVLLFHLVRGMSIKRGKGLDPAESRQPRKISDPLKGRNLCVGQELPSYLAPRTPTIPSLLLCLLPYFRSKSPPSTKIMIFHLYIDTMFPSQLIGHCFFV